MHTGHGINCAAEWRRAKYLNHLLLLLITSKIRSCHYILEAMPTPWKHWNLPPRSLIPAILDNQSFERGPAVTVSGMWRGAVTLITAVSTLQQVCSACSTQLTFQRRGWWQRHVMSFCTRRQKQSWTCAKVLRTHAIAEYVTGQMSSRIAGLASRICCDLEWSGVIICEMRHPRYSITPVTRVTGDWAAPGSPGNIPDNREYFNINIYLHNWI